MCYNTSYSNKFFKNSNNYILFLSIFVTKQSCNALMADMSFNIPYKELMFEGRFKISSLKKLLNLTRTHCDALGATCNL